MRNKVLKEAPLVKLAVCLMAGIVVGQYVAQPLLPVLAGLVAVTLLLGRYPQVQSVLIALCFVVLGALLMQRQRNALIVSWPEGEVPYEAVVTSEPVRKPKTVAVDLLMTANGRKLKAYITDDSHSRRLHVGDGLSVRSVIRPNREWHMGTFDYRRYLEIHGFTGSTFIGSRQWQKAQVKLNGLSYLERTRLFFLRFRRHLAGRLEGENTGGEAYAVVVAMALGDKSALTQELKEVYSATGASHVLALSGLHLGIIYTLLSLLIVGRRWHAFSQLLLVGGIWAFVLLVGLPVSVVRAALMLTVYALLSLGRRDKMSVNTLAFTAIVMLMASPLSLFDVGFQLSFMAVLSILLWLPMAEGLVPQPFLLQHRVVKWVWSVVVVSFAAQLGVAPLVAYYFGRFSTCFLLTNLIVLPAAVVILWLSIAVLAFPSLAYLLLYIADLLNTALAWLAALPGTSIGGLHPSAVQVLMVYVIIASLWLLADRLKE